ncbi:Hypothetical predicted protein, partial [Paramuricea clavata]
MIVHLDKGSDIIDRQLGFVDVSSDRTATALSTVIKGKLIQHENIMDKLIGQTYDGVSVMSGHLNGVQAQIQREYPFAHFVHCAAHRLNLVLCQAASSIAPVKIFFVNIAMLQGGKHFCLPITLSFPVLVIHNDKKTDFQYGMTRVERFKTFVTSLRTDAKYSEFYDKAVEKVGPPVTKDKDFHKDSCGELLKYIFQFHLQSSIPEVVKLLKMNGVISVTSASVERSFSCLKR